jgi:putative membrane protein
MDALYDSLAGVAGFTAYFSLSLLLLLAFKWTYARVTPHDEWQLVREERNVAAAVGFIGAVIGFALALSSAAANSVSLIDFLIWGVVALLAQILAFLIVRFIFLPSIVARIEQNEVSAGVILGGMSIAVGLLNGACMTY